MDTPQPLDTMVTERNQAERTLQHIMEGAHCLLWQADVEDIGTERLQWKMHFAGEEAAQRFLPLHVSAEQSYAAAWYRARLDEDRERTDLYGEQEIRAGRSYQQEFRCRSKVGALHWLSVNVRVETLGEGKWRCTGVCTDITQRKLAEEATHAMTRGAQCLLWYAFVAEQPEGLKWHIELQDEEAAHLFFPVVQPAGMSYQEASALARLPEDNPIMDARAADAIQSGKHGYTNQFRCLRADGEWRWLNEMVTVETLEPGRWRCVGVCTDFTEQKQAEARIKEAEIALLQANEQLARSNAQTEERFRLFVEGVQDYAIFILDTTGHVVTWNGGAARMKGYRAEEIIGKHFSCFFTDEDIRAGRPEHALQVATVAGHYEDEGWRVRRDGSLLMASMALTALRDESGSLKGFAKIARDVTETRKVELALREAKVQADAANLAKSEFLSRMSHELRTPLNAILGFGQILNAQQLTLLQQESVQYILTGGRHLLSLINEVLDLGPRRSRTP